MRPAEWRLSLYLTDERYTIRIIVKTRRREIFVTNYATVCSVSLNSVAVVMHQTTLVTLTQHKAKSTLHLYCNTYGSVCGNASTERPLVDENTLVLNASEAISGDTYLH